MTKEMTSRNSSERELHETNSESVGLTQQLVVGQANNDGVQAFAVGPVGHTENVMAVSGRVQTIDFKFFISDLAMKYNNDNIAKAFQIPKTRVSEWRGQNELLQQAYVEKYVVSVPCNPTIESQPDHQNIINTKSDIVTSSGAGRKKNSYNTEFKLRAVAFAEMSTNRAAAKEFKVHDKRIREWRKNKELLLTSPRDRKRLRGAGRKPASNNQIEQLLFNWLDEVKSESKSITADDLQEKAIEIASQVLPQGSTFSPSKGWIEQFLKMHHLFTTEESTSFSSYSNDEESSTSITPTMVDGNLKVPVEMTVIQQVPVNNKESDNNE